jgi:hypothetical protein
MRELETPHMRHQVKLQANFPEVNSAESKYGVISSIFFTTGRNKFVYPTKLGNCWFRFVLEDKVANVTVTQVGIS